MRGHPLTAWILMGAQICISVCPTSIQATNPGYRSFAAWIPGHAASIVILANDETASIQGLLKHLL